MALDPRASDPEIARLTEELRVANARAAESDETNRRLRSQLKSARDNTARLQKEIRAMRRSPSWRLTYPLRTVLRRILPRRF